MSTSTLPAANAETVTFPCGSGATYSVVMPAGIAVAGTKCSGALTLENKVKIIDDFAFAESRQTCFK